ncbi:MAG TPA: ATP-binding protein [Xanthomonadales bacterium]|nr:ATP-binding protein [Xanthomonadales bacterium]
MNSLLARLSTALLVIIALIGSGFYILEKFSSRLYYEELTQRLNGSIAMYVTGEHTLIEGGVVNQEAIARLARQAMVVNPTVEIYLLDREGQIVAHGVPQESVKLSHVDLNPVRQWVDGNVEMPFKGPDPRHPDQLKIFSASPVMDGDELQGYLYAVLGGQIYDDLATSIQGSYVRKVSLGATLAIVLAASLVGLLVFAMLTQRLRRLSRDVQEFTQSGFEQTTIIHPDPGSDEIGQLSRSFVSMAGKLKEQFETLKETDRVRRELISNVSHDLRTPLSSMHGYVDTLLIKNDTLDPEERRRYLEITRRHTQRLATLVGDLFELSKLESAQVKPELERFSLAELLHDVAQEFELQASDKGVTIKVETPGEPATVQADIGLMQRVLENLLRNALKYTPRDGDITIRLDPRADSVAVSVADTGCGIHPQDIDHIFDRFYRAEASASGGSSGLGLAIVKRILDLHGSRITVESALDKGTVFAFDLPTRQAA